MDNDDRLLDACKTNNYTTVVHCIKKLNANINYHKNDKSVLMYAVLQKNIKIVKFLCENGADKEYQDPVKNTVLMYAIYTCPIIAIYLITNGANIHAVNKFNENSLFIAAVIGNLSLIKFLHKKGADINLHNHNKVSPLVTVCGNRFYECAKYLIENGADVNITSKYNDNLLHGCIESDAYDIFKLLLMHKNLKIINEKNNNNVSPLLYAIIKNKSLYAEILISCGADTKSWDIMIYENVFQKGYL